MELLQVFWLALVQGITEFLPISSSGHLALMPWITGWQDQGLAFDVAVHVGTLLAVVLYFRRDIKLILRDWLRSIIGGAPTVYSKLGWSLGFATVLVGLAGITLEFVISDALRNPISIAVATAGFGVLLGLADRFGKRQRQIESIGWRDVLLIGAAQVLALIPGTSRSGITITAGLAAGLTREAAARFSFLLAIPVIALAGMWQSRRLFNAEGDNDWLALGVGALVSALVAWFCIHYFLRYVAKFSLLPFVIYRIFLGVILLAVFM